MPGWPFSGQSLEIWLHFKFVGLKRLFDVLTIFGNHLKLVGLKKFVWFFDSFFALLR